MKILLKCTIVLLIASMSISCGRDETPSNIEKKQEEQPKPEIEKIKDFIISKKKVQVSKGGLPISIEIESGNGDYEITDYNRSIISAEISADKTKINITGNELGETQLTIKDKKANKSINITILSITYPKLYELSKDGTTLIQWKDRSIVSIDMEKDPILKNVTKIDEKGFSGCKFLSSIILPKNLTTIKGEFLYGCTTLQKLVIPEKVTDMSSSNIINLTDIRNLTILAENPPKIIFSTLVNSNTYNVYVPQSSLEKYKTAPYWNGLGDRIKPITK